MGRSCFFFGGTMKYRGTIITQASGSLNGKVFSHNRGGPYIRNRTIPTDPNSTEQARMRTGMSTLVDNWQDTATLAQRRAWEDYSQTYPRADPLRAPRPPRRLLELPPPHILLPPL